MQKKSISRRDFIKAAGFAAGAGLLAACATPTPETVEVVVTATPAPTQPPEPAVLEVWWNTDVPDLAAMEAWEANPDNEVFQQKWYWGGLAKTMYPPFVAAHPGVSLNITSHSWDWDLRQNQLMALAAGIYPDVTYGEAYVNEFVQLGVLAPVSQAAADQFPVGTIRGAEFEGQFYGLPMSSGADVLFIHMGKWEEAGLDRNALPTTWEELVAACQAISEVNESDTWGNTCYYTYGPGGDSYGQAMRILHWFNQNNAPLGSDLGVPSANVAGAADTWLFHNQLMWTSTEALIQQAESEAGSGQLFNDGVIAIKPGWNNDATSVGAGDVDAVAIQFPTPPGGSPATIVIGNQINSPLKGGKNPELAVALVEETLLNDDTQIFLADNAGIWIPAKTSLLEQYATYDKLGGYKTETAQTMVRVTMQTLLEGGAGPLPGWPKNGSRIWAAWNEMYGRIWEQDMSQSEIQAELDTIQTTITGLVAKTG
jgi:maltose-binding protein MalE